MVETIATDTEPAVGLVQTDESEVPADAARSWAVAPNSRVVARVDCAGATAHFLDAHLVLTADGSATVVWHARYLDSGIARRLLKKW